MVHADDVVTRGRTTPDGHGDDMRPLAMENNTVKVIEGFNPKSLIPFVLSH